MSTILCQPRRGVSNFEWQLHQLEQLRLDVHKLQLRSWKILVAAAAANPFGILHKKSRFQLQKFVKISNVKTLDKIEILCYNIYRK